MSIIICAPRGLSRRRRGRRAPRGRARLAPGRADLSGGIFNQPPQALRVRRAGDAAVCDDGGDEFGGRHVEGRVLDGDAFGGEALLAYVRDLARVALLNWYLLAGRF